MGLPTLTQSKQLKQSLSSPSFCFPRAGIQLLGFSWGRVTPS